MADEPNPELEEKQPEINVVADPATDPERPVQVDLSKKETPKESQDDLMDRLDRLEKEREKSDRRNEYLNRNLSKALNDVKNLTEQLKNPYPQFQPKEDKAPTREEIDQVAQEDWQKGVGSIVEQKIQEQERIRQQKLNEQQQRDAQEKALEQSRQNVRNRYPEIDNDQSETAKLYMEVLNEDPGLLQNIKGPELAMYKMEEKMRDKGLTPAPLRDLVDQRTEQEIIRRTRTGHGSIPTGNPAGSKNYTLTQAEIDQAKDLGVPLEEYVKMHRLSQRELKEGVSVDD